MTKARSLLLSIASLVAANVASFFTLSNNQSMGVYPIDADSIGLPLMEGAILSIMLLVLLCAAIFIPKGKIFGSALSVALCCLAALLSGASTVSWAIPNHYTMAIAYGCVLVVCGILAAIYLRKLASNIEVKRDAPQATRPLP